MYEKDKSNVRFTWSLSSYFAYIFYAFLLVSLSIAFVYNNIPQQAVAQTSMQGHASSLLTVKNSKLEILYIAAWEKPYNVSSKDLNRTSSPNLNDIIKNASDTSFQNLTSQNYTIYYERAVGLTPSLTASCTLYTKSLQPQHAQEIRKILEDSNFFDIPSNLLPTDAADFNAYRITIEDEEGKRKHTVDASNFTAPAELKILIQYLNSLC
jgi:hypothetical protein